MAIVSCPECSKKLKVADTSVGKKVKCSCGQVFVAETEAATPPPKKPAAAAAAVEKVIVACTECGAKLKVAMTSLGKKMKCSKCAEVFVAALEEEIEEAPPPPPPAKKSAKPVKPVSIDDDDEEEAPKPKSKAKAKPAKDDDEDMDAFLNYAAEESQAETEEPELDDDLGDDEDDDEEAFAAPKGKPGKKPQFEDEEIPDWRKPKGKKPAFEEEESDWKPAKKSARPVRAVDDDDDDDAPRRAGPPQYPSRTGATLFTLFLLLLYVGFFAVIFLEVLKPEDFGIPKVKLNAAAPQKKLGGPAPDKVGDKGIGKDKEADKDKSKDKTDDKDKVNGKDKEADKDKSKDDKEKTKDKTEDKLAAAKLNGKWVIESALQNGKADDKAKGEILEFADGKVTGLGGAPPVPYTLNVAKDPGWIDITISLDPDKTLTIAGLFKFDGEKLHLCMPSGKEPSKRPENFDAPESSVAILRRATKDDAKVSRVQSVNNLKQIGIAIHSFHDANKHLPPAASSGKDDPDGKPLLSWRVALLPYLDEIELYQAFDLDKAWDDPHNMKLIAKMPKVYMIPGVDAKEGMTHYRTLVGPGTMLEPQKGPGGKLIGRTLVGIVDGVSQTIMVVEAKDPTIWTKPDDLAYDPKGPLPKFGVAPTGFNALFGDATVRLISPKVAEEVLRPYLTGNNGLPRQPLDADENKGSDEKIPPPKKKGDDKQKSDDKEPDKHKAAIGKLDALGVVVQADDGMPVRAFSNKASDESLALLAALPTLEDINLTSSRGFTDVGLAHLKKLPRLKRLWLTDAAVGDESMAHIADMKSLEDLNLGSTKITEKGLAHLKGLTNLRRFVAPNGITDDGLAQLSELSNMRSLNLVGQEKITDAGLAHLKGMAQLEELILNRAPISDAGLAHLAPLSKMTKMWLTGAGITDKGLASLSKMTELTELKLTETKIEGSGLTHLRDMKRLVQLELPDSLLTDAVLVNLKGVDNLRVLGASRTKVTDAGEKTLKTVLPDCSIFK